MTKMDVMSINIHRMFEYLFCADESSSFLNLRFENDVKMYGTQTAWVTHSTSSWFENDVEQRAEPQALLFVLHHSFVLTLTVFLEITILNTKYSGLYFIEIYQPFSEIYPSVTEIYQRNFDIFRKNIKFIVTFFEKKERQNFFCLSQ